jgi:hypothetical protein
MDAVEKCEHIIAGLEMADGPAWTTQSYLSQAAAIRRVLADRTALLDACERMMEWHRCTMAHNPPGPVVIQLGAAIEQATKESDFDAVKRCEELLASAVELNAKRNGEEPEEVFEVEYLDDEDVAAIRQILAERAAMIEAWPSAPIKGCVSGHLVGRDERYLVLGVDGPAYPTREAAVLAAAGIKREGEE